MRILLPALLASLTLATTARAETSAPTDVGCFGADPVLPGAVPANVSGIPIVGNVSLVSASLLAPDGTVVSDTLVDQGTYSVLAIDKPLTPGLTYTLRWSDSCVGLQTRSFLVTDAVALPESAGSLTVGPQAFDFFNGACDAFGRPFLQLHRPVSFDAAKELATLISMSRVELVVDGELVTRLSPGQFSGSVGRISQSCPTEPSKRVVRARVVLPNGPTIESAPMNVEITCPDTPPRPCGSPDPDAVTEPPPSEDPPPKGPEATPGGDEPERSAAYGCASSRGATGGVELVAIALAMGLAARSTRRRR